MLKCVSQALVFACLVALPAAGQEFEKGLDAYNNGDYGTALSSLQPLALKGERRAQHYLAFMYLRGKGVPQSDSKAVTWFRRAAEQGHVKAQYNLGVMYHIGLGVKQNDSQAVKWFRAASDQGHNEAHQNLIFMRTKGRRLHSEADSIETEIGSRIQAAKKLLRNKQAQARAVASRSVARPQVVTEKSMSDAARTLAAIAPAAGTPAEKKPEAKAPAAQKPEPKAIVKNSPADKKPAPMVMAKIKPTQPPKTPKLNSAVGRTDDAIKTTPLPPKTSPSADKQAALAIASDKKQAVKAEDYHVQLGAVKIKSRALQEAGRLNRAHKSILGNLKIVPVRSDLGKRGIFYRLRAGPLTGWSSANALCRELSARKQRCIVAKP